MTKKQFVGGKGMEFRVKGSYCGLCYKHVHGQMSVNFQATILSVKNVRSL